METSRWVGPGGFLLGIGKPPEGEGRPRAPINPLSLSRKRQVGIGHFGPEKGERPTNPKVRWPFLNSHLPGCVDG